MKKAIDKCCDTPGFKLFARVDHHDAMARTGYKERKTVSTATVTQRVPNAGPYSEAIQLYTDSLRIQLQRDMNEAVKPIIRRQ